MKRNGTVDTNDNSLTHGRRRYAFSLPVWLNLRVCVSEDDIDNSDPDERRIKSDWLDPFKAEVMKLAGSNHCVNDIKVLTDDMEAFETLTDEECAEEGGPRQPKTFSGTIEVVIQGQFTFSEDEIDDPASDDPDICSSARESLAAEIEELVKEEYEVAGVDVLDDALNSVFLGITED